MKLITTLLLLFSFTITSAHADCDWSLIKPSSDGQTFIYSKELHLCVGTLVQNSKLQEQQITDLKKAIDLKDLALKISDDRATLWSNTSQDLENRLQKVDSMQKTNEVLWVSLGVLGTILTGYMTARLIRN